MFGADYRIAHRRLSGGKGTHQPWPFGDGTFRHRGASSRPATPRSNTKACRSARAWLDDRSGLQQFFALAQAVPGPNIDADNEIADSRQNDGKPPKLIDERLVRQEGRAPSHPRTSDFGDGSVEQHQAEKDDEKRQLREHDAADGERGSSERLRAVSLERQHSDPRCDE